MNAFHNHDAAAARGSSAARVSANSRFKTAIQMRALRTSRTPTRLLACRGWLWKKTRQPCHLCKLSACLVCLCFSVDTLALMELGGTRTASVIAAAVAVIV
jgi:hypothetical protein